MHLSGHTGTSLWPMFHIHTSRLELYVLHSHILVSSLMFDFQICFSSRFMQVRAMSVLCQTLPMLPPASQIDRWVDQLVHLPPGLLRMMMSWWIRGSWFWPTFLQVYNPLLWNLLSIPCTKNYHNYYHFGYMQTTFVNFSAYSGYILQVWWTKLSSLISIF